MNRFLKPLLERFKGKPAGNEFIFILSAMRSGSTLLQHLVGQQEDVLSAGETKIEYHAEKDLEELKSYLREYNNIEGDNKGRNRYLEKCVHNRYFKEPFPVRGNTVRFLFIIREPLAAITSLLELEGWPYAESRESAAWYYDDRFKALVAFAEKLENPGQALFLSYEDLLNNPEAHTSRISSFLECVTPLSTDYPKQRWTAKLSLGDVSDNIRTSRIVPNKRRDLVELNGETEKELNQLYSDTKEKLGNICKG